MCFHVASSSGLVMLRGPQEGWAFPGGGGHVGSVSRAPSGEEGPRPSQASRSLPICPPAGPGGGGQGRREKQDPRVGGSESRRCWSSGHKSRWVSLHGDSRVGGGNPTSGHKAASSYSDPHQVLTVPVSKVAVLTRLHSVSQAQVQEPMPVCPCIEHLPRARTLLGDTDGGDGGAQMGRVLPSGA